MTQGSKVAEEVDLRTQWEAAGWRSEDCGRCAAGTRAEPLTGEPVECECNGGILWRSPKGRYALYPGGPFRG